MSNAPRRSFADLLKLSSACGVTEFTDVIDSPYLVATGTLKGEMQTGAATKDTGFLQLDGDPSHSLGSKNPLAGQVIPVRKVLRDDPSRIYVGRSAGNDIVIDDRSISSRHAWFERQGEAMTVLDAGSRNGTFVNLARTEKGAAKAVKDEDVVTFGRVSFQFYRPEALYFALRAFSGTP